MLRLIRAGGKLGDRFVSFLSFCNTIKQLQGQGCNHPVVADSLEDRDDLRSATKLFEFFHLLGMTAVGSSSTSFGFLSETPDPDSHLSKDTNWIIGDPTGAAARLGCNSSLPGEKTEHYSYELRTTFRHLSIGRHVFFVTIRPKPNCNI
jgi:hypothetical protein